MEKLFTSWLVVDYKTGSFKAYKRLPKGLKASEIPIKVQLTIEVPEKPEVVATGHIRLSKEQVSKMVIEELG